MADQKTLSRSSQKGSGQQPLVNTLPVPSVHPKLLRVQRFSTRMPNRQPKMGTHPYILKHRISDIPLFKLRRSANTPTASQKKPLRATHTATDATEQKQEAPVIFQPLSVPRTSIVKTSHVRRRTSTASRPQHTTKTAASLTDAGKLLNARLNLPLLTGLKKTNNAKRAAATTMGVPARYATRLRPVTGRLSMTAKRAKNLPPNQNSVSTALPYYRCVSLSRPFDSAPFGFMFNRISSGTFTSTFYTAFFRDAWTKIYFFLFQDFKFPG